MAPRISNYAFLFLALPVVLFGFFAVLNVYMNWEHHKQNISDFFDVDFEAVDVVIVPLLNPAHHDHIGYAEGSSFATSGESLPELKAVVTACHELLYTGGDNPSEDRPAHVRAASSLTWSHFNQLVVLQDDVNFIALIDINEDIDFSDTETRNSSYFDTQNTPLANQQRVLGGRHTHRRKDALSTRLGDVWSIAVPKVDGSRQFHKLKSRKLDLECSIYLPDHRLLIAFGSGSAKGRSKIVLWHDREKHQAHYVDHELLVVKDAGTLYKAFREEKRFSGSELNLEGASLFRDRKGRDIVRLFQRGNGAEHDGMPPISASCDIVLTELLEYLENPEVNSVPKFRSIKQYDLGKLLGVKLSFTDAARIESSSIPSSSEYLVFLTGAEDSPDSFHDGAVMGSAFGMLHCEPFSKKCTGMQVPLTTSDGKLFREKAEGVELERSDSSRAIIVIDPDDPLVPGKICSVRLSGFPFINK